MVNNLNKNTGSLAWRLLSSAAVIPVELVALA